LNYLVENNFGLFQIQELMLENLRKKRSQLWELIPTVVSSLPEDLVVLISEYCTFSPIPVVTQALSRSKLTYDQQKSTLDSSSLSLSPNSSSSLHTPFSASPLSLASPSSSVSSSPPQSSSSTSTTASSSDQFQVEFEKKRKEFSSILLADKHLNDHPSDTSSINVT
jgi:hypothetical protein